MIKIQYDGKSKFIKRLCKVVNSKAELGETENSAYRGDRGKIAYEHSQAKHAQTDATKVETSTTNGNIKINGEESNVYTHPESHSISEVSGLQEILDANDNSINEINSNLDRLELSDVAGGKNLVDISKSTKGYWLDSSGNLNADAGNNITDYIEVSGNVVLSGLVGNSVSFCWYDINKNYISGFSYNNSTTIIATKPSNAKYIRATFKDNNMDSFMIEYGTQGTPYEPYIPSVKMLAEETSNINGSLSRHNLVSLNKNLVQGCLGNSGSSNPGGEIVNGKYVYDNIYHECNAGDLITLRTNLYRWHGIAFYDSNKTFLNMSEDGRSKQEWKAKAPTNSKYYRYYLGGEGYNITPQTCGNVYIYTNNSIDVLKTDLDDIPKNVNELKTDLDDIVSNVDYTIHDYARFKGDILLSGNRIKIKGEIIPSIDCGPWWGIMSIPFSAILDKRLTSNQFYIDNDGTGIYCNAKLTANTSYNIDMEFQVNVSPNNRYLALKNSVLYETKTDLDKLNSLPKGTIIQIEADKDTINTTKEKYGWQYLGTSSIEYDNGSYVSMATNVYRKNN